MAKTKKDAADSLFEGAPTACKQLHKAAKKALREKARKNWWLKFGKDSASD